MLQMKNILDMAGTKHHADEHGILKSPAAQARVQGYTGEQCENCGSVRVKQNGTCISVRGLWNDDWLFVRLD